jgi:hypothetical protein
MIVAERKKFENILKMLAPYKRVLVLACGSCVTVCLSGGEKQADELASQLRLAAKAGGREITVDVDCITRQCDREFIANLKSYRSMGVSPMSPTGVPPVSVPSSSVSSLEEQQQSQQQQQRHGQDAHATHGQDARATLFSQYDAVLSLACGVGVGFMSEQAPATPVLPGLNTSFYGACTVPGTWAEYCGGCGDCELHHTGGICPVVRCSKGLINGTCGGTSKGKCEVSKDMDCGWYLIFKKLQETGRLDEYRKVRPAKKWSRDRNGKGVRRLTHKELSQLEE